MYLLSSWVGVGVRGWVFCSVANKGGWGGGRENKQKETKKIHKRRASTHTPSCTHTHKPSPPLSYRCKHGKKQGPSPTRNPCPLSGLCFRNAPIWSQGKVHSLHSPSLFFGCLLMWWMLFILAPLLCMTYLHIYLHILSSWHVCGSLLVCCCVSVCVWVLDIVHLGIFQQISRLLMMMLDVVFVCVRVSIYLWTLHKHKQRHNYTHTLVVSFSVSVCVCVCVCSHLGSVHLWCVHTTLFLLCMSM